MQYLSVKAAGQASAGRPRPEGGCRHRAAIGRRRSPPLGGCTPRNSPPLRGSRTPGARRRMGQEKMGLKPARLSSPWNPMQVSPPSPEPPIRLSPLGSSPPSQGSQCTGWDEGRGLARTFLPRAPHLEAHIASLAAQTGEEEEDEGQEAGAGNEDHGVGRSQRGLAQGEAVCGRAQDWAGVASSE